MTNGFEVKVEFVSRDDLSKRELVRMKDYSNAIGLDDATQDGPIIINPDYYAKLVVHNEHSREDKDYVKYIIIDKAGNKYVTGSESFWNSFSDIASDMEGEDFEIEVVRKPSKNYQNKTFLTCNLV